MKRDRRSAAPSGSQRSERTDTFSIEAYNSPKTRYADENAGTIFSAALFCLSALLVIFLGWAFTGEVNIWVIGIAVLVATFLVLTVRVASQWEQVVILRFGKYHHTADPGIFITIPFVDHVALRADQRVQLTGFGAEEALTADMVPVNVNAIVFWMVWNAEKACMEVEDYYDSVALASQTTLRDAIGRNAITDLISRRVRLDEELKSAIAEKVEPWGISVLSVEIRDVVIPRSLQEAMSAEARAERERDAQIVLSEVESDIAAMLHEASEIYRDDECAFKLRQMHLLNQGVKGAGGTLVVPSAYTQGFTEEAAREATGGER